MTNDVITDIINKSENEESLLRDLVFPVTLSQKLDSTSFPDAAFGGAVDSQVNLNNIGGEVCQKNSIDDVRLTKMDTLTEEECEVLSSECDKQDDSLPIHVLAVGDALSPEQQTSVDSASLHQFHSEENYSAPLPNASAADNDENNNSFVDSSKSSDVMHDLDNRTGSSDLIVDVDQISESVNLVSMEDPTENSDTALSLDHCKPSNISAHDLSEESSSNSFLDFTLDSNEHERAETSIKTSEKIEHSRTSSDASQKSNSKDEEVQQGTAADQANSDVNRVDSFTNDVLQNGWASFEVSESDSKQQEGNVMEPSSSALIDSKPKIDNAMKNSWTSFDESIDNLSSIHTAQETTLNVFHAQEVQLVETVSVSDEIEETKEKNGKLADDNHMRKSWASFDDSEGTVHQATQEMTLNVLTATMEKMKAPSDEDNFNVEKLCVSKTKSMNTSEKRGKMSKPALQTWASFDDSDLLSGIPTKKSVEGSMSMFSLLYFFSYLFEFWSRVSSGSEEVKS